MNNLNAPAPPSATLSIPLRLQWQVSTRVQPSEHVLRVAGMFGLGVDPTRHVQIIPPTDLTLAPGKLIFITGASGSGKSSLLRLIHEAVREREDVHLVRFDALPDPPDKPLVDCFGSLPLEQVMRLLSLAGLNDAFVMLRSPHELSDGQRYRFRLAQTMAAAGNFGFRVSDFGFGSRAEHARDGTPVKHTPKMCLVLADEFGATLDRLTAQIIARNVRKWTRRSLNHADDPAPPEGDDAGPACAGDRKFQGSGVCFVAATTHDDLLEALEPDVLIYKDLGEGIEVLTRTDPS